MTSNLTSNDISPPSPLDCFNGSLLIVTLDAKMSQSVENVVCNIPNLVRLSDPEESRVVWRECNESEARFPHHLHVRGDLSSGGAMNAGA